LTINEFAPRAFHGVTSLIDTFAVKRRFTGTCYKVSCGSISAALSEGTKFYPLLASVKEWQARRWLREELIH